MDQINGIPKACHSCIIDQAKSAAEFTNLTREQTARVITTAWRGIQNSEREKLLVQHVIRRVADTVIEELNEIENFDIFQKVKRVSNTIAITYYPQFKKIIEESNNPITKAVQISAAGNSIDFGAKSHGNIDLDKEIKNCTEMAFKRFDIDAFSNKIKGAQTILYIADNSGEIVFDSLLIETINKQYPQINITVAVREKPIL